MRHRPIVAPLTVDGEALSVDGANPSIACDKYTR